MSVMTEALDKCPNCGDENVDDWLAEQCDAGGANADTPDAPPVAEVPTCAGRGAGCIA